MSRFSAAVRWLWASPRATQGWQTRAIVIKQAYSIMRITHSSSGYLYHRQGEHSQVEGGIRVNLYYAFCTGSTLKSHMVGARTSRWGIVLFTSKKVRE